MRGCLLTRCFLFLLPLAGAPALGSAGAAPPSETRPRTGITAWDTGRPSAQELAPAAVAGRNDWAVIPVGQTRPSFQGDAVLSNGRVAAVLRRQGEAVEVHAVKPDGAAARLRLRLRLQTAAGEPAARLEHVALVENSRGSGCLEAAFRTAKGDEVAARFRIKRGDVALQVEPRAGAGKLRVECPGRFVVLPDFFADDITLDAARLPLAAVDLPSENFVLHPTGGGDALATCVFENRKQDVRVTLAGAGDQRQVTGSEIGFEGKKVWVALLETPHPTLSPSGGEGHKEPLSPSGGEGHKETLSPSGGEGGVRGIWHVHDLNAADAGKVIPLGWRMPFPAQWRVDFTRPDELTDSWEMLLQEKKDGAYTKPSWLGGGDQTLGTNRSRWNTVLGRYPYPCWSDPEGHGYLQPLRGKVLAFQGPALVYPINRVRQTPLDAFTVVDVMRNTLGVGPCQHILDLEGQKSEYKGRATCAVRDKLTPIYEQHQQKQKRAEIDQTLDEGLTFVKHIRGRITRYVAFGRQMRAYLAEQQTTRPELAGFIAEMDRLTQEIDRRVAARAAKIKTPEHVARMNAEFRKDVLDDDGPEAVTHCKEYTKALVEIGDNQDELSGECRWVIKALRQRAGIRMALDPRVAPIAAEIRARTQEALRNPANHEGARH